MMPVAFLDLARTTAALRKEIDGAIAEVLDAGRYVLGARLEAFETAFASYCGVRYAVGVGSGTDALQLALAACGVGQNDEVITVTNTCVPTAAAISALGAVPVFADVEPRTYTIDPAALEARITPRTRAIVPVHLYGQCADMDGVLAIARRRGIRVIEDCAQAHGARFDGRIAGSMGGAGCYSFYPTKNLGALGDAGMIVTDDAALATAVRAARNYGLTPGGAYETKSANSRLDELQAAIMLATLPRLEARNERRRAIAARYTSAFAGTAIVCPVEAPRRRHVYHLYVVRVPGRDGFRRRLEERGIGTMIHYPMLVHRTPAYRERARDERHLPVSCRVVDEIVSLPLYPDLTDGEVDAVIAAALASIG
jgi:dTDP-4-amino-4,6-dideoxygalactose transaminase